MHSKPPARYFVRPSDVAPYQPANHTGTVNRRLIGAENVGAKHVEVVLGVIEQGRGALPHAHPGVEQVCYMLEGRARAEVTPHVFTVVSDTPAKLLVIYSPPYAENPQKVVR